MSPTANVFDIKSTSLDILALFLKTPQIDELSQALDARFGDRSGKQRLSETFVLDIGALENPAALDVKSVLLLLNRYGIQVVALRHPNLAYAKLARKHNLVWLPATLPRPLPLVDNLVNDPAMKSAVNAIANTDASHALIIDRPVRAGQQIYARGGDLIALAMVSAGAEVIADGNIHVYAPLRGRALAGARGDTTSRIFTRCMEAELVSIAGVYRTIEQALPDSIRSKPTQVTLKNERIVMTALSE